MSAEWPNGFSVPAGGVATTFAPLLGGAFVLQTSSLDHPDAPDAHIVITRDEKRPGGFLEHYFDSRGVVRMYEMTFDGTHWELLRTTPDFTSLEFEQRFVGTVSADGNTIEGHYDMAHGPGEWELDFSITYRRL